jgi:transposase
MITPTVNTGYMNHHLLFISQEAGEDVHVVLVLDRAGWHVAKNLKVPHNITLLYLPPYSPELNPVERLWAFIKSHYLSNRLYDDYTHLFNAACQAWNKISCEQFKTICNAAWLMHEN